MADSGSPHHPLEVLPAMLNLVLVQTGKFFRDPSQHDLRHLSLTKGIINQVVPTANQRFHDALDEIEIDILKAKSVMERDLALIRTKRAERDRNTGALKARILHEGTSKAPAVDGVAHVTNAGPPGKSPTIPDNALSEAVVATEPSNEAAKSPSCSQNGLGAEAISEKLVQKRPSTTVQEDLKGMDDSIQLVTAVEPTEVEEERLQPSATEPIPETNMSLSENPTGTPVASTYQDANFESMFNDNETGGGDEQMDFDLGFTDDANMSQDLLNSSTFDNIGMSNEDMTNLHSTSNDDINTLLPGLENYVSEGADFTMLDVPTKAATQSTNTTTNTNGGAAVLSSHQHTDTAPIESTFDDLFASGTYLGGDGDGDDDMAGNGDFGDFDDQWFESQS